ncbi:barstar (barnase inhibitor) [Nocardia tenerifensis]|uniref:Barstar (Barnase inhibitor) n=1 Tax=Nocardia tenerifensis TaxID=228006 RepID=A0A318K8Y0_9NOCA|nr:barstar family protein [Nocardia tenerifensis]PXX66436.1 barstar (barnase inhibitor) [Nocardia tenerifensis]
MTKVMPLSQFLARPVDLETGAQRSAAPVFGAALVDAAELSGVRYRAPSGYVVRELRGTKMRTVARLFDEVASALQFPYYFGENKDAFDECLRDLDDFVGDGTGYVVVVRDSVYLLADEPAERDWLAEAMRDCADYWARKGVPFRVVLQGESTGLHEVSLDLADGGGVR